MLIEKFNLDLTNFTKYSNPVNFYPIFLDVSYFFNEYSNKPQLCYKSDRRNYVLNHLFLTNNFDLFQLMSVFSLENF